MSRRSGGGIGNVDNVKEPIVFGKYPYYLWIAFCVMTGIGVISMMLIWLISI